MRRILLAGAAILTLAAPAAAADLPVKAPPMMAPAGPPVFSWSGFYIGINGGWAQERNKREDQYGNYWTYGPGDSHSLKLDGGLFGGQIGYDWQVGGNWVFGLEAMGDAAWLDKTDHDVFWSGDSWRGRTNAIFLGTARLGYAVDNWLLYAKGGYAGSNLKSDMSYGGYSISHSDWHHGWTVGGGVEYAFAQNWIIGVEYDHMEFQRKDWNTGFDSFRDGTKVDAVLGRLSYKIF